MSDTAARAREQRIAEIKKRAKQFAVDHNWWSDSDPVVDDLTAFAESELQLAAQSASAELKADTLFGVYCSGNPESIPKDRAIFWEGWQRVADYVNGQLRQHGHGAQGENSCGTAVNAHTLTSEAIHPIVETAERFEAHHLPNEEWKSLSEESREKISKWFDLAEKYLQAILNDGAQGQGVGPRCPKCSGQLGFTHDRIMTFLSCYKCKETFELHSAEDMVKFFSPVPSPESATKEGK